MKANPTCWRCGTELGTAYSTELVAAAQHRQQVAPDGTGFATVLAATSACSWNCLAVLAAELAGPDADAAVQVVAERERQVTAEGYSPEHDDNHRVGMLAEAGVCYVVESLPPEQVESAPPASWPWDAEWWKPKGPERDLVRGAALVAAEADRLVRARRLAAERF